MKTLKDFDFKNKVVLLRTDINSDLVDGKLVESERIKPASETISYLINQEAKVIVVSHQGNPGKSDFSSLKKHAEFLNEYVQINFIPDVLGKKSDKAISNLKPGQAILLDNIRLEDDEFHPEKESNRIVSFFLPRIDIYVNDAFSVCHRAHTSIVSFPKFKPSCAGLVLEREVSALKSIDIKDSIYILGGAKPEENIKLLRPGKKIIAGGIFGQLCLIAKGYDLGDKNEQVNRSLVKDYDKVVDQLKNKLKTIKVSVPIDYAVDVNETREEFDLEEFPTNYIIYDIGKKTQKIFIKEISKAKAVYMKGPLGFSSKPEFSEGTFNILKTIASSKLFSLIGGGHLSDAIRDSKIPQSSFSHISLSGGALLDYVAGEKLVGLEALG
jgi:phosphoglycerate kinase